MAEEILIHHDESRQYECKLTDYLLTKGWRVVGDLETKTDKWVKFENGKMVAIEGDKDWQKDSNGSNFCH